MSWQIICLSVIGIWTLYAVIEKIMGAVHPFRAAAAALAGGAVALAAVNLCSEFTGVYVPLSGMNLCVSSLLGIPGVIALLMIPMFF